MSIWTRKYIYLLNLWDNDVIRYMVDKKLCLLRLLNKLNNMKKIKIS